LPPVGIPRGKDWSATCTLPTAVRQHDDRCSEGVRIMKSSTDTRDRLGLNTDFKQGVAFALLSMTMFALLLLIRRPEWANPWLIASVFTFAVWRLGRQRSKVN
jgi:hypothetical protein